MNKERMTRSDDWNAGAEAMREAVVACVLGGSFLHAEAPTARFAQEVAAAIRALPLPPAPFEMRAPVTRIGRNDDDKMAAIDTRSLQDHRNEAYQNGWNDGYTEGKKA